ncbi:aconitase iron-sulfur domain-containing protein [Penicillium concentricum]|uniref:Aconitase iron-sulfur domain-containing protein n=1 Tax=Penicillium concentricum TaxID=293559 RepID=A0A9W9SDY7_9EURO|nr:aconitase iron-sulfur domain-containing protein [Penicillium concentricum]KAJ5374368.1 aconitase iron-sulfur domain-containing protein [Penicillium concentricum]
MPRASITYSFEHSLTGDARAFIHAVAKILEGTRGIRLEECSIEDRNPSQTLLYLTQESHISPPGPGCSIVTNIDAFITHLSNELDAGGSPADASTLRYVLDLCYTETERGGLGFSEAGCIDWSLSQMQLQHLQDLLEAWLESLNSAESGRCLPAPLSVKASATRPMTLAEKILAHHAFSLPSAHGLKSGDFVRTSVDWIVASELSWVVGHFIIPLSVDEDFQSEDCAS